MARERLQKVLAAAGVASRRACEALIAAGRVTVDGRIAKLGDVADPEVEKILLDGKPVGPASAPVHLVLHKPAGVTSTVRDRHAATTVIDLVPRALMPPEGRLYPVGRLDQDSEGLLLLTNDGPWADGIVHPRHGVDREYAVGLRRPLGADPLAAIERGIELEEGIATFVRIKPLGAGEVARLTETLEPTPDPAMAWWSVVLRQGWRRQVRRMFAAVGEPVERLVRIRVGQVRLERLRSGKIRPLTDGEVRTLAGEPAPRRKNRTRSAAPPAGTPATRRPKR